MTAIASDTLIDVGERARLAAKRRHPLIRIPSPVGLRPAWEAAARLGFIDTRFFPAPSSIILALVKSAQSGELLANTSISLQRLLWGFLLGGTPALILGIIMGISRPVRAFIDPLVA